MPKEVRTLDIWNHNPALYQLSYGHHITSEIPLGSVTQRYDLISNPAIDYSSPIRCRSGQLQGLSTDGDADSKVLYCHLYHTKWHRRTDKCDEKAISTPFLWWFILYFNKSSYIWAYRRDVTLSTFAVRLPTTYISIIIFHTFYNHITLPWTRPNSLRPLPRSLS